MAGFSPHAAVQVIHAGEIPDEVTGYLFLSSTCSPRVRKARECNVFSHVYL